MNFNRSRAQLRCEQFLGCKDDPEKWRQIDFDNFELTKTHANYLKSDLLLDAVDLYFKGLLSLFEAIFSINRSFFSWATIKAYYSVYYFLKCTLAVKGYGLIRKKGLYLIKASDGEKPIRKNNPKYNSDHMGTINYFQDVYGQSDILLSNKIDEETAYVWLMQRREQVNYRERIFHEPLCTLFWEHIFETVQKNKLVELLEKYVDDKFIYCFQEEHASLAIPIKRAILTKDDLIGGQIINPVGLEKTRILRGLAQFNWQKYDLISLLCD